MFNLYSKLLNYESPSYAHRTLTAVLNDGCDLSSWQNFLDYFNDLWAGAYYPSQGTFIFHQNSHRSCISNRMYELLDKVVRGEES